MAKKTNPDPRGRMAAVIKQNVRRRAGELGLNKAKLIGRIEMQGVEYKTAHAQVSSVWDGKVATPHSNTLDRLKVALDFKTVDEILLDPDSTSKEGAVAAVIASLSTAPAASRDEIIDDCRRLLDDSQLSPYFRMAVKVLANLK